MQLEVYFNDYDTIVMVKIVITMMMTSMMVLQKGLLRQFDNYDDGDGYDGDDGSLAYSNHDRIPPRWNMVGLCHRHMSPVLWRNVYFHSVLPSVVCIQKEATYWDFIEHE